MIKVAVGVLSGSRFWVFESHWFLRGMLLLLGISFQQGAGVVGVALQ
jgi:hypothetical protein